MFWYGEAARIWGHVNPDDDEAVDAFYLVTFLSLSDKDRAEIIEFLLCNDDRPPTLTVCDTGSDGQASND